MRAEHAILAFNRGIVSRLALARLDLTKLKFSAEEQTNWMPRALGSMMLRPGMGWLGSRAGRAKLIEFIFSAQDTALVEMTAALLRVWKSDALVARSASAASISNGTFTSNLTDWTDQDQVGATSAWVTGGYMGLTGDGTNYAIREQLVAASSGAHTLRITVSRGPVQLRIGSTSLGSEVLRDTSLGAGVHSIVINSTGSFYVQFRSLLARQVLVDSVEIEAAGTLTLPTPYVEADLPYLRFVQSGDVIYLACRNYQQRKIERRSNGSWSFVLYQPTDGPFRIENVTPTTLTPSGISGNITLTASADVFASGHVGALFSLTSQGQVVTASFSAANVFSNPIRVTGVADARLFSIVIAGGFSATVILQRSVGDTSSWQDVPGEYYISSTAKSYDDGLDNQIVYYRLGIKTGDYASGTVDVTLSYSSGSITGIVRVTGYTSTTQVSAEVLTTLGGTSATNVWAEGQWSDYRGWPSAVAIDDGRLWWAGKDKFNGSISDAFESFDANFEGDAGPISRSIGFGPVDSINWLLSLDRLIAGTDSLELVCRSSALDEPLSPVNFRPKKSGTQGTAQIPAQDIDGSGVFVQRCLSRLYELRPSDTSQSYTEDDLTAICPDLCAAGIRGIKVQRQPDTRIHVWLADGTVAVLILDRAENLVCWLKVETDGIVEDVAVLPGAEEDAVYYGVNRTINGVTAYYLERWALEREAQGGAITKLADSFVMVSGSSASLPHLAGKTVTMWAGGRDLGTITVAADGTANWGHYYTDLCIGLPYEARFKSTKLAYVAPPGMSGLGATKILYSLALVLADTHAQGLQFGQSFDEMDDLPQVEDGYPIDLESVWDAYEKPPIPMPGVWEVDARLCLRAASPRPATVLAAVIGQASHR